MNYYYRSLKDGRCEVVCTRCFATIGSATQIASIRKLEEDHSCNSQAFAASSQKKPLSRHRHSRAQFVMRIVSEFKKFRRLRNTLLALAAAMSLYVLPTIFEFSALHDWNPWLAVVLPGDLAGCACLVLVFRRVKSGIVLYLFLTAIEACFYSLHIVSLRALALFVDLIPALIVSFIVLRLPGERADLITIS